MEGIASVILAAGKGTRMKSDLVKVLHPILGRPMLSYTVDLSLHHIKAEKTIVVIGHQADQIEERFGDSRIEFVHQDEQLGTGHAVLQVLPFLRGFTGIALILCGDVPLVKAETLRSFIDTFLENHSTIAVLTAVVKNPYGYGRIIRGEEGWLERIVEEKDASNEERLIREINTGIYCVRSAFLMEGLKEIGKENVQGEYYLTDLVEVARKRDLRCSAHMVADPVEVMGINTRVDLATATEVLRQEKVQELMLSGVTIVDPRTTYVDRTVEIGKDTTLYPNCTLQGRTRIGERCVIEPNSKISDTEIGNGVTIRSYSVITESRIEEGAVIGPFAHLKPLNEVKTNVTKDVPEGAPAISRVKQKNIRGWSKKIELHHKKGRKKKV
ncbi:MAG: bifunctional UDP-N-acetylglucosamine diphosphorylase/glucosamine-1-phosphate N-acetyltransferase GlmU [Deltaproteobacteria bacterium]|nr:bifunctional UDP-N-acetylglucosamine diphosphorylase/glucosamine-1-phosphate N-acetyltransferase GlmU [Deltaproteobacteria bacterium]